MHKLIVAVATIFAVISCDCLTHETSADGMTAARHSKKARHVHGCAQTGCVVHRRFRCPEYYPCHPLYGAYGPYGGQVFWGAYTEAGWGRR
jgi:hypothetical protein